MMVKSKGSARQSKGKVVRCKRLRTLQAVLLTAGSIPYTAPLFSGWLRAGYTGTEANIYDARKMLGGLKNESG